MEYTVKELAELAGVTRRTLRYYDEIGLLRPNYTNISGYRIYTQKEVDLLQQILFYRAMNMKLADIQKIISQPDFNLVKALEEHYRELIYKKNQLDQLILTVEKTIAYNKGEINMTNIEKFEGLKKEQLAENECKYGEEIRNKYGEKQINESNKRFMDLSEEDFKKMQKIENNLFQSLKEVVKTKDFESEAAKNVYQNHKNWLAFSWNSYSPEAHIGLAEMYVTDVRFADYYNNQVGPEANTILRDIIVIYAK